jgi:hypothetical protein
MPCIVRQEFITMRGPGGKGIAQVAIQATTLPSPKPKPTLPTVEIDHSTQELVNASKQAEEVFVQPNASTASLHGTRLPPMDKSTTSLGSEGTHLSDLNSSASSIPSTNMAHRSSVAAITTQFRRFSAVLGQAMMPVAAGSSNPGGGEGDPVGLKCRLTFVHLQWTMVVKDFVDRVLGDHDAV